jgi:hypothetical protein
MSPSLASSALVIGIFLLGALLGALLTSLLYRSLHGAAV